MMNANMNNANANANNNMINNDNNTCDEIISDLSLGQEEFHIVLKVLNANKILIKLVSKDDFLSLYDYSIELSYEDFCKLGKSFRTYDNRNDIFNVLKNLFDSIRMPFNQFNMTSNVSLKYGNDFYSILLCLYIPLLNGGKEEINIEFNKKEKNIKVQCLRLREKYLQIKSIFYGNKNRRNYMGINNMGNFNMRNNFDMNDMHNIGRTYDIRTEDNMISKNDEIVKKIRYVLESNSL